MVRDERVPAADVICCLMKAKKREAFVVLCLVPRYLLEDVGRGSVDPFLISDYTHGEVKFENSRFWQLLVDV